MEILHRAVGLVAVALLAVSLVACVPDPANRLSPAPTTVEPTDTPKPTAAGPTPTPSFARPTPTPQPTFLSYVVRTGDTLTSIAKSYGVSHQTIGRL